MNTENPRALALQILTRCASDSVYSNLALDTALNRHRLTDADRSLVTTLVYGVLERRLTLDFYIEQLSSRPLSQLDRTVLTLLRLGVYQLRFLNRIPPHAALNETVSLAQRSAKGYVNAVLREYTRRGDVLPLPDREREPLRYLCVAHSFPQPLCERFVHIFGMARTEAIFAAANAHPSTITLRVNTRKTTKQALQEQLEAQGFSTAPALHATDALRLEGGNPRTLPGFSEGAFFIQDEASQLCVAAVNAQAGMTVYDICACPGSKSFGLAIDMNDQGKLIAFDLHANKLSLVRSGAQRLGLTCIQTVTRDGRDFDESLVGSADRVLCDVPCSGFGVLAKKPDVRYKSLSDVAHLPDVQLAILENAARYVKSGGVLVYSTCTLLPEENEQNVARFLSRHPEFTLCAFRADDFNAPDGMLTLTPDEHGTDGFFIAKLIKE